MIANAPPLRADARRNRERVLAAAERAFAEEGILVPLDEIARRAGVGAGTVYRHFHTKEALFEEVVTGRIEQMIAEARRLAVADLPGEAFFGFLGRVVQRALFNHALCDALDVGIRPRFGASGIEEDFDDALGTLLIRAQRAGEARHDMDVADLRAILVGCMVTERQRREQPGDPGRLAAIVLDGLRAGGPGEPTPARPADVTKHAPKAHEDRNETDRVGGNESGEAICEVCGAPIRAAATGRPPKFCGSSCRQRAHRRRRRTGSQERGLRD